MPIAAPLLIPFAQAIGIAIAGRGLMEISEQVQKFMQNNPDVSQKILSMITPQMEGLSGLLSKKKEPTEEIQDTEVDEPKRRLTSEEKSERIKEAVRRGREGRGNYSDPDAEGPASSIRGNVIRVVEDLGLASKKRNAPKDPDPDSESGEKEITGSSFTEMFRQLGKDKASTGEFKDLGAMLKNYVKNRKKDGGIINTQLTKGMK
jgi:hypothetical protein